MGQKINDMELRPCRPRPKVPVQQQAYAAIIQAARKRIPADEAAGLKQIDMIAIKHI